MRCTYGLSYRNSVRLTVRPAVRLSVTLVHCVHMVRPTTMISSPYDSSIILVSGDITFIPKFEGGHPERGRWMRVGSVRIGDLRPISRRISKTVRDTTKVTINRPWLTLKWPWTAIMHSTALHTCVLEPTTKICTKIDPYYQRQKRSPGILVSSKVSFMRIFAGVRWRGGVKWEWGGRKWRFSLVSLYLPNLHI